MFNSVIISVQRILVFCIYPVFAVTQEVVTLDANGNVAAYVDVIKKYNEIARKAAPKNHPSVRVVQATIAGNQSGRLWMVVEYDDLANLARMQSQMEGKEEVAAIAQEFGQACSIVSSSFGNQLYYHEGTN